MIRLALVALTLGSLVASVGALAPAPFPRHRRDRADGKVEGNEANERKLHDAIRLRRNDQVTIVLPVGAKWKLPRTVVGGNGLPRNVGFTLQGRGLSITGARDGWDISGRFEGAAKLSLHFRDLHQRKSGFTVIVRLVLTKSKTSPNR